MNSSTELVTVLLPFQEVNHYFKLALESIQNQTYINLEILLLNNGDSILAEYHFNADSRIRLIDCRDLKPLSQVLNRGIEIASGKFLARMDADDVSDVSRIEKQLTYLLSNPEVGIVGSSIAVINEEGIVISYRSQPLSHSEIIAKIINNNTFFHPTVMLRRDVLIGQKGPYSRWFWRAQDYELWTRLLRMNRGANLNEVLVMYREHENQSGREIQHESLFFFRLAQFKECLNRLKNRDINVSPTFALITLSRVIKEFSQYLPRLLYRQLLKLKRKIK